MDGSGRSADAADKLRSFSQSARVKSAAKIAGLVVHKADLSYLTNECHFVRCLQLGNTRVELFGEYLNVNPYTIRIIDQGRKITRVHEFYCDVVSICDKPHLV